MAIPSLQLVFATPFSKPALSHVVSGSSPSLLPSPGYLIDLNCSLSALDCLISSITTAITTAKPSPNALLSMVKTTMPARTLMTNINSYWYEPRHRVISKLRASLSHFVVLCRNINYRRPVYVPDSIALATMKNAAVAASAAGTVPVTPRGIPR